MPAMQTISTAELAEVGEALQRIAEDSSTVEECAQRWMFYLYDNLLDDRGGPACVLVRCFRTSRYARLSTELRDLATAAAAGIQLDQPTQCMVLLGSAGANARWNSRHKSQGHRVIPLSSPEMVERSPMIAQLFRQLGIDVHEMLQPADDLLREQHERALGVFYVRDAHGSPHIPAQSEFVHRYNVRSVIGFGGVLPTGSVFAIIMFTRANVTQPVAESFQMLANTMKAHILRFEADN